MPVNALKLVATKEGFQAFAILFPSVLPQHLVDFFETALQRDSPKAKSRGAVEAHKAISKILVITLSNESGLLVRMRKALSYVKPPDGVLEYLWIKEELDPEDDVAPVSSLLSIVTLKFGDDSIGGLK